MHSKINLALKAFSEWEHVSCTDFGKDDGELQAVQVQVRRRETERQMEYRLASYAHIKEEREKEIWQKLRYCNKDSEEAAGYFSRLFATPIVQQLPMRVQEVSNCLSYTFVFNILCLGSSADL